MREVERRRSKTGGRESKKVEKFYFSEDQWREIESSGGIRMVGRRSRAIGRVTHREKLKGEAEFMAKSKSARREIIDNRLGRRDDRQSPVRGRSRTAGRVTHREGEVEFMVKSNSARREIIDNRLGRRDDRQSPERGRSRTAGSPTLTERLGGGGQRGGKKSRSTMEVRIEDRTAAVRRSKTTGRSSLEQNLGSGIGAVRRNRTTGRSTLEERSGGDHSVLEHSKTSGRHGRFVDLEGKRNSRQQSRRNLRQQLSGVDHSNYSLACKFFKQRRCIWGDDCRFIHDEVERSLVVAQPETGRRRQPRIPCSEYFPAEKRSNGASHGSKSKPKGGDNTQHQLEDKVQKVRETNNDKSGKIGKGDKAGKVEETGKAKVGDTRKERKRKLEEVQKLERSMTLPRGMPRENVNHSNDEEQQTREGRSLVVDKKEDMEKKAWLVDEVQKLEEAVRKKKKQTSLRSQTGSMKNQNRLRGRRVVLGERKDDAGATPRRLNMKQGTVAIEKLFEGGDARFTPSCSRVLDQSPKPLAASLHADASSPGAASSGSVTSEEQHIQKPDGSLKLCAREGGEQRWSLNDTLEMCVSEKTREELFHAGSDNVETSSGDGKHGVDNSLIGRDIVGSSSSRNRLRVTHLITKLAILKQIFSICCFFHDCLTSLHCPWEPSPPHNHLQLPNIPATTLEEQKWQRCARHRWGPFACTDVVVACV